MTEQEKALRLEYLIQMATHKYYGIYDIYTQIGEIIKNWDASMVMADRMATLVRSFNVKSREMLALYEEYKKIYDELNPTPIPEQ